MIWKEKYEIKYEKTWNLLNKIKDERDTIHQGIESSNSLREREVFTKDIFLYERKRFSDTIQELKSIIDSLPVN